MQLCLLLRWYILHTNFILCLSPKQVDYDSTCWIEIIADVKWRGRNKFAVTVSFFFSFTAVQQRWMHVVTEQLSCTNRSQLPSLCIWCLSDAQYSHVSAHKTLAGPSLAHGSWCALTELQQLRPSQKGPFVKSFHWSFLKAQSLLLKPYKKLK